MKITVIIPTITVPFMTHATIAILTADLTYALDCSAFCYDFHQAAASFLSL